MHEVLQRPEWADCVPGPKLARFQESTNATAEPLWRDTPKTQGFARVLREPNRWSASETNGVACGALRTQCCVWRPAALLFCLGMAIDGGA